MGKLIFKDLYLFSPSEKLAKKISFAPGRTIITSDAHDGTDRGKSVIMKALYHTMGADCYFEGKWEDSTKTYILHFSVDNNEYYMYRHNKLFKMFNSEKKLLFSVISRHELSERLSNITGFAVKLPPRERDADDGYVQELEIASAVYNYLLYFVDQDYQNGSQFASFQHLGEYPDFKENVLYYHFGAFDDDYYMLVQEQDTFLAESRRLENEQKMTCMMLDKIFENIHSVSYSKDIEHLRADVNRTKDEYNKLSNALNRLRRKLIQLRNEKADMDHRLHALTLFGKENDLQIASLNNHICPFCKSEISDVIDLRIKKYSTGDDIILLSSDMQYSIMEIDRKIAEYEEEYSQWLSKLKKYEESMDIASTEINDILRHKGFIDIKESVSEDLDSIRISISENEQKLKEVRKSLRKYDQIKKKINERYYTLMLADKNRFGLEGINAKSFENIKRTFTAGGSNNPLSTIIWYVNLIQLKHEFNPSAIDFPVVFDSPNNAETDETKKRQIYSYICERITENQLIVSGLGFSGDEILDSFDSVITLTNNKYELLCPEDYTANVSLLQELNNK
ncbi:hypothetical protein [Intestinibacillus sp. Marseille-P6563]|uniref:hypothetical protein n=1 Tax=Intestinibacillus sp. Marseille-P6563 TaxID=2364792 RepID=UPI000F04F09B|nr:hypothetical protein [Intestinibacillus sp. Marseille-P6563]